MSETMQASGIRWTRERAALFAMACLLAGIAGGWSIRAARVQTTAAVSVAAVNPAPAPSSAAPQAVAATHLKEMADAQAAPLLDRLKADPGNPEPLRDLGNLYYDAQQYPLAVDYYARALKARPADAAVRTDMGTAFWYMGNADRALEEFNKALTSVPNNPNTLFNLGLVKWKGKKDAAGAAAAWKKLLATDPAYEQKDQVLKLLAEVKETAATH